MLSLVDNENDEVIRKLPSDAVMAIVKAYNNVLATIKSQISYDVEAKKAATWWATGWLDVCSHKCGIPLICLRPMAIFAHSDCTRCS